MNNPTIFLFPLLALLLGALIGVLVTYLIVKAKKAADKKQILSAQEEATRIVNEALKDADSKKREILIEAKAEAKGIRNEAQSLKAESDREIKERRAEITRRENILNQKEESLDKRSDRLSEKEDAITERIENAKRREKEAEELKNTELQRISEIAGLTRAEAEKRLLDAVEETLTHEKAVKIRDYERQIRDDEETLAREIITRAIQRTATDHVSEDTVVAVDLPNDEMKGRIIGREGRNIRAIETITGCDLLIDDTPDQITVSCFDPVRREIGRLTLEKLVSDGRIHPGRIEEMHEKSRREIDREIRIAGEKAALDCEITGLDPQLVKIIGRLKYRTSFGQNVLNHSIEVARLAGLMAAEIGANEKIARRAGLLHDLGKALDRDYEGTHIELGVEYAKKYHEKEAVIHAIEAHHGDVEAKTIEACLVQAADAISAARPGARSENIEFYIKRLEKLEAIATSFDGVEKCFAIQAGRELRIMVKPDKITDDKMTILARDVAERIESEMQYPGSIKVTIIRESRAEASAT